MNRRDFHKLAAAAFGGMLAGTGLAHGDEKKEAKPKDEKKDPFLQEPHICRGLGGCGEKPGQNACKGKSECAVPLDDKAWKKARTRYEEVMKKEGKKFG